MGFSPTFTRTHTPEHRGPASSRRRRMVGFHARGARHRSTVRARARARRSGSPLGCACSGRNGAREYLREKGWLGTKAGSQARTTRHTAHDTAAGVLQRRVAGAMLTLALGCTREQPPPSPSFAAQNTTARRPVHRNPRHDATRGTRHNGAA
jgi:hypothetical protein